MRIKPIRRLGGGSEGGHPVGEAPLAFHPLKKHLFINQRMNISDTFYVALCMTILIIGVVYWFWTQNQYIQRKLNLLENIVYEMKTNLNNVPEPPSEPESVEKKEYPPAPSSEIGEDEDLLHEQLHAELENTNENTIVEKPVAEYQEQAQEIKEYSDFEAVANTQEEIADDLQPGGIGSSMSVDVPADASGSSLDAMTLKELKRLAEQRKIPGASNMRKGALISALRNGVDKDSISEMEGLNVIL